MNKVERVTRIDERSSFEVGNTDVKVVKFNLQFLVNDPVIQRFGEELDTYLRSNLDSNYCLCFEQLTFLSSAGLGKLITFDKNHKKVHNGESPALTNICREIYLPCFRITRLDRLFQIYHTIEDYKRTLQGESVSLPRYEDFSDAGGNVDK